MEKSKLDNAKDRIAIFLRDRISYAINTKDTDLVTEEAIRKLLDHELGDGDDSCAT